MLRIFFETDLDEWSELVSLEQRGESLAVQGNVRRGLKLTLSQANGTFAEAQTSLQVSRLTA